MPENLELNLGPTQSEFVLDEAEIVQLVGPMGEGKTYGGVAGCIVHADRCGRDIEAALIRDTFRNIETSTIKDIKEYLEDWVTFTAGGRRCTIHTKPRVNLDLFGIDDEHSISKMQGPQYSLVWLEEPAPIYEKTNAGLPIGVFNMAVARSARQRGAVPRVQITHNPADEDHWTSLLEDEPYNYVELQDPTSGQWIVIRKSTHYIDPGENKFLPAIARAMNVAAFKDDPAKYKRYVLGQKASVHLGKAVTPGYHPSRHFARETLPVFKGELIQCWDSWGHPTCIIAQVNPVSGQLVFHDVCWGEGNTGVEELIEEQLFPLLNRPKYQGKIQSWRVMGDQSMKTRDQSTARTSAAKKIEDAFSKDKVRFEGGPAHWRTIREPLNRSFKRGLNDGEPAVKLSRSCTRLHRAFNGGWYYKVDANGNRIGDKPVKGIHSHAGDAAANAICILLPYDPRKATERPRKGEIDKLARSYAGGNFSRSGHGQGGHMPVVQPASLQEINLYGKI